MAEKAQAETLRLSEKRLDGDINEARLGQIFALIIAIVGLSLAAYTAYIGAHPTVSITLGGGSLALLIAPFLKRKQEA